MALSRTFPALTLAALALLSGCEREPAKREPVREARVVQAARPVPKPPAPVLITVPDDPKATYTLLSVERRGPLHSAVTMRTTDEGASFARREIRCGEQEFRYTDEADSLAALSAAPGDGDFLEVSEGSPSWHVLRAVCGKA